MNEELASRREFIEKLATTAYDKASTFATIVIAGGFAGLFGIWGWVANYLSRWQTLTIALLLALSLSLFIAWQVFAMVTSASQHRRFAMAILAKDVDFDTAMQRLNQANGRASTLTMRLWPVAIWIIGLPAALGALLLVGACAQHLLAGR